MSIGTFTLAGDDLQNAREILPLAVAYGVEDIASCIGPESGGTRDDIIEEIMAVLRAGKVAANLGPPGDPAGPGLLHWTEDWERAVRRVLVVWMEWCHDTASDHADETIMEVTPPDEAQFWTACAEKAERAIHTLDAGGWGVTS